MASEILRLKTISEMHKGLGLEPPQHPLISVLDVKDLHVPENMKNTDLRITTDFYSIAKKDASCGMLYGRNRYDFDQGVLSFIAPNQVMGSTGEGGEAEGWMLFFHPDLIRNSNLGREISKYSFFSYDVHEALHLSKKEEDILDDIIDKIKYEYDQNIDGHTAGLFVSHLELLLNYCMRFYERQFHTRKNQNVDILSKVEGLLKKYYDANRQHETGTPTIQYIAERVNLSANYLSDLLKKETGRNAKEHINAFVVEKAKTLLLSTAQNVSEIAFDLGFNYPHYFSRMFKQHTGMTPKQYRELDLN